MAVTSPAALRRRAYSKSLRRFARPPVIVGAIVLFSALLAAVFSLRITSFEPDELGYTRLAIGIAHALTPFTVSHGGAQRLNQLYPLLIAPLWGLFGNVTAFRLTHAWSALLMASAAIPTYLLARDVLRERWAAYLATILVAVLPWMVISTAELTEVAAYPACAWALVAMQRSLAQPSPRRDVVALIAIAVATYGRLQLIILAPTLFLAMLVHELGYVVAERRREPDVGRHVLTRLVRRHVVLTVAGVIGVVVGIPLLLSGALTTAFGFYGNTLTGAALGAPTFDLARSFLTAFALGLGAIPAALTIGFVFSALMAPVARRVHAFASLTLVVVVALLAQVAEISVRFNFAVVQERYFFYVAPLFVVGLFAALLATRHPVRTVIGGALVLAVLIATTDYQSPQTAFWYQISPGITSYYFWVLPLFGAQSTATAGSDVSALIPTGVAVGLAGLILAGLLVRLRAAGVVVGIACAAIVFCLAESVHAMRTVVRGTPAGPGLGTKSLRDADWVDRALPSNPQVGQLIEANGGLAATSALWNNNVFWNRIVATALAPANIPLRSYLATQSLTADPRTGALAVGGRTSNGVGRAPGAPRYLLVTARGFPIFPMGRLVARSPAGEIELIRLAEPLRAQYVVHGVSPNGWMSLNQPLSVNVYGLGGGRRRCAQVFLTLSLSQVMSASETLTVTVAARHRRLALTPGATATVEQRVCQAAGGAPRLRLTMAQPPAGGGLIVTPQLRAVRVSSAS